MSVVVVQGANGDASVASPCIDVCELDGQGVCLGCFRHSDEIMAWPSLDNAGKRSVLERVERRRTLAAHHS